MTVCSLFLGKVQFTSCKTTLVISRILALYFLFRICDESFVLEVAVLFDRAVNFSICFEYESEVNYEIEFQGYVIYFVTIALRYIVFLLFMQ